MTKVIADDIINGSLVGTTTSQTISNKSIDATANTITNIANTNIATSAAIARSKIASGTNNALLANNSSGVLSEATDITLGTNNLTLANTKHLELQAATDSTTTGTAASLAAFTAGAVRLTNASLVSLGNIPAGSNGQQLIIFNRTGVVISILDDSSASGTAANRIYTGTAASLSLAINAAIALQYDSTTSRWQVIGGSGGSATPDGETTIINYITNGTAEIDTTGWATYNNTAGTAPVTGTGGSASITYTRTTSTPLRGTASFSLAKLGTNRQGDGVSYDFTVDAADQGKVLQASFEYKVDSGTLADNDLSVWIYDKTNGVLIQPAPYLIKNSGIVEKFAVEFQTAINSTSYRFIIHVSSTSTAAYTLDLDNFILGPQATSYGSAVTDWVAYTPILSWTSGITSNVAYYRRAGDSIEIQGRIVTSGAVTATGLTINLPNGLTADSTKSSTAGEMTRGLFSALQVGVNLFTGFAVYNNATSLTLWAQNATGSYTTPSQVTNTVPFTWAATHELTYTYSIPISGWSSSQVMSSDADTRVVSFVGYIPNNQALTANVTDVIATTIKDSHGGWGGSSYTVKVPGDYSMCAGLYITAVTGTLKVYKNGTNIMYFMAFPSINVLYSGSVLIPNLVAGDVISLRGDNAFTLAGNTLNTIAISRLSGPSQIAASESVNAIYTGAPPTGSLGASFNTATFGTKVKDSHNLYSSGAYPVPVSGVYSVKASFGITATFVAGNASVIAIYVNGVQTRAITYRGLATVSLFTLHISADILCLAGDVITIKSYTEGTSPTYSSTAADNFMAISRIGNY